MCDAISRPKGNEGRRQRVAGPQVFAPAATLPAAQNLTSPNKKTHQRSQSDATGLFQTIRRSHSGNSSLINADAFQRLLRNSRGVRSESRDSLLTRRFVLYCRECLNNRGSPTKSCDKISIGNDSVVQFYVMTAVWEN